MACQERYQLQRYQATVVCGNLSAHNFTIRSFDMGLYEVFFAGGKTINMKKCQSAMFPSLKSHPPSTYNTPENF